MITYKFNSGKRFRAPRIEKNTDNSRFSATLDVYELPNGYKWFCGHLDGLQTTLGIMRTEPFK